MRPIIARSLLFLTGAASTGTVVATAEFVLPDKVIIANVVEYPDVACLTAGSFDRDTVGLFHTASGLKRATKAQKRASARLNTLFAERCVIVRLEVDTIETTQPDTTTPPDTSAQPDTLPTPPTDTLPTPPADTQPLPPSIDTLLTTLARIGPTVSPDSATVLGRGYALMDPLFSQWDSLRWAKDSSLWNAADYYDRSLIYYSRCARTGELRYCQRGAEIALSYRRGYLHASNYQTSPHWAQLDGVAMHYWTTGDDSSKYAVGRAAWNLAATLPWLRTGNYTDARQQARALTGALLAWQMNAPSPPVGGWAAALDAGITNIISQQSPDGAWRYPVNTCDVSLNYMGAMLADAFIRVYENYRPDARLPAVISRTADFLWSQWRPNDAVPSFNYYERLCVNQHGSGGPTATPDLTGLYAPVFAWLARHDSKYQPMADAVFLSAMRGLYPHGSKQFNQAFTSTWRALGYLP